MKRWTKEEDDILISNRTAGVSPKDIHSILPHRSLGAVHTRLNLLRKREGLIFPHGNLTWSDDELLNAVRKYKTTEALNTYRQKHEPWATTVCRRFGTWSDALNLVGLPTNKGNLTAEKSTRLYLVYFTDCDLYKIGLTQKTVKDRFNLRNSVQELDFIIIEDLTEARCLEKELLSILKPYQAKTYPDYMYKDGHTECFAGIEISKLEDIYNL